MPQVFWNAGCQLVALNFQTLGKGFLNIYTSSLNYLVNEPYLLAGIGMGRAKLPDS
jgi:hypothetical protein